MQMLMRNARHATHMREISYSLLLDPTAVFILPQKIINNLYYSSFPTFFND